MRKSRSVAIVLKSRNPTGMYRRCSEDTLGTTIDKSGLTSNLEFNLIKDEYGNYVKSQDYMPNSVAFALVKDRYLNEGLELKEKENLGKIKKEA